MPLGSELETSNDYIAPRNATESQLAKLWAQLLECDEHSISVKVGFFDAGGDSLQVIELLCLIEENFGKKIPGSTLFSLPTIEDMARYLEGEDNAAEEVIAINDRAKQRKQMMASRNRRPVSEKNG